MNKQYGWVSEYKRKKFFEGQKLRKEKELESLLYNGENINNKTIAVMLDLEGTVEFIDDEKAKMFLRQLNFIRKKFGAKTAIISISTHYNNSEEIKKTLDIFSKNLTSGIKIGISFYLGGTYDYEKKTDDFKGKDFNRDKVETFSNYYVNNIELDNQWFAIIDDSINADTYKKYQDNHSMLLARPSQKENITLRNNFMSISSTIKGFDGVLQILNEYINSIRNLSSIAILETQRKLITHLSSWEISQKIFNRDYAFLERYFSEGYADEADYHDTLIKLTYAYQDKRPSKEELFHLKKIIELINQYFILNDEQKSIERVLKIKNIFESYDN